MTVINVRALFCFVIYGIFQSFIVRELHAVIYRDTLEKFSESLLSVFLFEIVYNLNDGSGFPVRNFNDFFVSRETFGKNKQSIFCSLFPYDTIHFPMPE